MVGRQKEKIYTMAKVITISGYAESGKDTVAKKLKDSLEKRGQRVVITHYADMLKYICKQYFGWDGKKDEKGRALLQHLGTDVVRAKDPNYWVYMMVKIIDMFKDEWDFVLIPDCRFPNEAEIMKERFHGRAVRVVRPDYVNHLTPEQRNHPSETSMNDYTFDYLVVNTSWDALENEIYMLTRWALNDDKKDSNRP